MGNWSTTNPLCALHISSYLLMSRHISSYLFVSLHVYSYLFILRHSILIVASLWSSFLREIEQPYLVWFSEPNPVYLFRKHMKKYILLAMVANCIEFVRQPLGLRSQVYWATIADRYRVYTWCTDGVDSVHPSCRLAGVFFSWNCQWKKVWPEILSPVLARSMFIPFYPFISLPLS